MTNLKAVNVGMNKYCGPAVLSILTGKSTDECARVISSINGSYNVAGVQLNDLLRAADRLGFNQVAYHPRGSLYGTLVGLVNDDGMYIVTLPNHFVCIEVKERVIYFCDNHTKEPMPAASSARLLQKVMALHKVIARPKPPEPATRKYKVRVDREYLRIKRAYITVDAKSQPEAKQQALDIARTKSDTDSVWEDYDEICQGDKVWSIEELE